MLTGFYSAASALEATARMHEVAAHNLAHADVPGFRRQMVVLETFEQTLSQALDGQPVSDILGTRVSEVRTVFEPGDLLWTDNPLDLAIRGDAFFMLEGANGPLYTRNGTFQMGPDGLLQSQSGMPLMGRPTIPPGTAQVTIAEDGTILADGAEVGQLELRRFTNPGLLVPVGMTLFEAPAGVAPLPAAQAGGTAGESGSTVHQGYRERANVQVIDELVQMIAALRYYEAAQRALRSLDGAVEQTTSTQAG